MKQPEHLELSPYPPLGHNFVSSCLTWFFIPTLLNHTHTHTHTHTPTHPPPSNLSLLHLTWPACLPHSGHIPYFSEKGICQRHKFSLLFVPKEMDGAGAGRLFGWAEIPNKRRIKDISCISYLWSPKSLFSFLLRKTQLHQQENQIISLLTCWVSKPGRTRLVSVWSLSVSWFGLGFLPSVCTIVKWFGGDNMNHLGMLWW